MKKMNVVATVLLISLLLFSQVLAELSSSSNAETSSVSQIQAFKRTYHHHHHHRPRFNCGNACAMRCRATSRKKVCYRACGSCCAKCQCVPPGTYGNTAACPCYANLRTHANKLKCP